MSGFTAIGGVSATLRALLIDRMELPDTIGPFSVTIGPPYFTSSDNAPHAEPARINLFLYRVTENGYLQNQEIPGRAASSGYGHPPLSLNLHYLITAYGNTVDPQDATIFDDLDAHRLLGSAMRVLHDVPIVSERLLSLNPPAGVLILDESLRDGYEQIRLSLEPLNLEDISKIWTALALRYRLSAAYLVNVVQIESKRPRSFPKPVGQPISPINGPLPGDPPSPGPWVQAITIQTPTITDVRARHGGAVNELPYPYASVSDRLILRGTSLAGPETHVVIGDLSVPALSATPTRVEVDIPDVSIPGSGAIPVERRLQPGVRTVRVVAHDPQLGQRSFSSNEAVFMLVPFVDAPNVKYVAGPARHLTIAGTRLLPAGRGAAETVIGRGQVDRADYDPTSTAIGLVVPIPTTLPMQGAQVLLGGALPDPLPLGAGPHSLRVKIGGTTGALQTRTFATGSLARSDLPAIVEGMIRDAMPAVVPPALPDARFRDARVVLWEDQLLVLAGDRVSPIVIDSPAGSFATTLGLMAAQPVGAADAYLSGVIESPPPLSAPTPQFRVQIGAAIAIVVPVSKSMTSLEALAVDLQTALNGFGPQEYKKALVAVAGRQIVLIPGKAGLVTIDADPAGDQQTVAELQLRASFSVRVRVNGAESIDPAVVVLPQ